LSNKPVVRGYAETRHKAKSWSRERRAVARIEATPLGLDTRFVVTNVEYGAAEWVYNAFYCARGQAENLIKLHKTQLASDRTSCRSAIANQVRLALHTAAYWLMLTVRDAIPKPRHPETARSRQRRVLDPAAAADQDRRARHRNREPRPSRFRRRLPGGRPLPRPARSPRPARPLNGGARSPSARRHPSNAFVNVPAVKR
jgi:Transposase DDE domain group 1